MNASTRRAYGGYLDFLAEGYDANGLAYEGLGDKMALEVLISDSGTPSPSSAKGPS